MTIAALFVAAGGCYYGLPDVDPWDKERDARLYAGPHPVVAHPPCQLWVNFAALNYKRYGGEHNKPGNDGGCFKSALESVRRWGGVLEHPAFSNAWAAHGLKPPPRDSIAGSLFDWTGWLRTGLCEWTCEVWQSSYGHPARKRTWLYYVGLRAPDDRRAARGRSDRSTRQLHHDGRRRAEVHGQLLAVQGGAGAAVQRRSDRDGDG